jgi:hypothetical protein
MSGGRGAADNRRACHLLFCYMAGMPTILKQRQSKNNNQQEQRPCNNQQLLNHDVQICTMIYDLG